MHLPRQLAAFLVIGFAISTSPAMSGGVPVLAEVRDHLEKAQNCYDRGSFSNAMAHANVILVSNEITYSVKFENLPQASQPKANLALKEALEAWKTALGDSILFKQVDDPKDAEVQVRFLQDVMMRGEPVAGFANWKRTIIPDADGKAEGKYDADLQIRLRDLQYQPMHLDSIRHEIMHEMGHVLGLEDSPLVGNLMGPLDTNHPVSKPRDSEAKAVLDLRAAAEKIRLAAAAQGKS